MNLNAILSFVRPRQKPLFIFFLIATLVMLTLLDRVAAPMKGPKAPLGMISFELAGTFEKSQAMLKDWDANTRLRAAFSLGLDYVFMLTYPVAFGLACSLAAGVFRARNLKIHRLGPALIAGQGVAAVLDVVENIALMRILLGEASSQLPVLAFWCAAIKFGLILIGFGFYATAFVIHGLGMIIRFMKH